MSSIADKIVRCVCIYHSQHLPLLVAQSHLLVSFNVHGVIYIGDDADGAYPAFVWV